LRVFYAKNVAKPSKGAKMSELKGKELNALLAKLNEKGCLRLRGKRNTLIFGVALGEIIAMRRGRGGGKLR
jgi:hypothetical protein